MQLTLVAASSLPAVHTMLLKAPCARSYIERRVGWVLTHLFNLIIKDAEDTLRHVCRAVLENEDTPLEERKQLAEGCLEIARAFQVSWRTAELRLTSQHDCVAARGSAATSPCLPAKQVAQSCPSGASTACKRLSRQLAAAG